MRTHNPTPYVAALIAADLIAEEHDRGWPRGQRYVFAEVMVPQYCHDRGCVLGWIAYVLDYGEYERLDRVAEFMGYADADHFYRALSRACARSLGPAHELDWYDCADAAARALRVLAREHRQD